MFKHGEIDMYHPTTRVLTVLELLQSHQRLSGPELAQRLEVDVRTVRRYVTMLQDLGIPIDAERGRHGAYRLKPGFKLPPLMFTEDEVLALALGLLAARKIGLAAVTPAVEGALAKIERVLPAALRERVQALQQTLVLDVPEASVAAAGSLVVLFSAAASQARRLLVRYASARGEETERAVDPYGLVYREGRWYAVGYCHLRGGPRVFRLDRVKSAAFLDEPFTPPDGFDTLEFMVHSFATMPGTWAVEVLLETTPEEARRLIPPAFATLEDVPAGVLLRCYVESLDWMARFLAGLECPKSILRPQELRDALRRLAVELQELADRGVEEHNGDVAR